MISKKLTKALTEQIGHEFAASHSYLGVAVYFAHRSLDKWAAFFSAQAEEERQHALKIVHFLTDVGAEFSLAPVPEAKTKFASAKAAVKAALKSEQGVSAQFHAMAETALKEKDYTSLQFLQWFIEEQVEEEALMGEVLDILEGVENPFLAEPLLPGRKE
ncbi:MAG: ferritin [Armatimonadetes bacterium]|nr:ferritin [Armatimonadota bacterium]